MLALVAVTMATWSGVAAADSGSFDGCPLLSEGDSGDCVKTLQFDLDEVNPAYNLQQDGEFGSATRIAVLDFQGRNHLGADGLVGSEVASALRRQLSDPVQASPPVYPECAALTDQRQLSMCVMAVWCNGQDLGMEHGECVPMDAGAAVGAGKSPLECAQELAGGKVNEEVTKDASAEAAASEAAKLAAKRLSQGITVGEGTKCLFWDLPDH
jgi:hypothetical protein